MINDEGATQVTARNTDVASSKQQKTTIVTITDSTFFIAVYILVLSLKYHKVNCQRINILGINLSVSQKKAFTQFENVFVYDANEHPPRHPCTRKCEAVLTAENDDSDYITLLDGDSIVVGDISPYIYHDKPYLTSRIKSTEEDASNFSKCYEKGELREQLPSKVLEIWREDVSENDKCAIKNTIASGNFSVHKKHLDFIKKWEHQMLKVLPEYTPSQVYVSHDFRSIAYSQIDESVLNSLLAFSKDPPTVKSGKLDYDPTAYVAHLGPHPKYWNFWSLNKIKYLSPILEFTEWAQKNNYIVPDLPWTVKKQYMILSYSVAFAYEIYQTLRKFSRTIYRIFK